jgi:oxygen-independent coproporphyrinogen-3 oxidase
MLSRNWLQVVLIDDWQSGGFGIYIHWPYCEAKCPYCDFNSHVSREIDHSRWLRAYLSEIERFRSLLPGRALNSIFFGGGTPSLMAPETVAEVIAAIKGAWPQGNDLEITLEANPSSVEAGRFAAFADAGVNRISMGIQALNDADLKRLGRIHTVAEARQAFEIANKYFNRVSFDLIYARQDQSVPAWEAELKDALSMAVDHLSLYQLTIEKGTAFGDRYKRGKLKGLPSEDDAAAMYEVTQDICDAAGMPAYEVSNHAKPGAESRHNCVYWRYGDYIGIGPGAHGRITYEGQRKATEAWSMPSRWLAEVENGAPEKQSIALSRQEQGVEYVMMGLRLSDGIDARRYQAIAGKPLNPEGLSHLTDIGMIFVRDNVIRTTSQGRMLLNSVIDEILS